MGQATSKGNEVNSKMKQPCRDSNTGRSDLWSNTLPLDHGNLNNEEIYCFNWPKQQVALSINFYNWKNVICRSRNTLTTIYKVLVFQKKNCTQNNYYSVIISTAYIQYTQTAFAYAPFIQNLRKKNWYKRWKKSNCFKIKGDVKKTLRT